MDALNGTVGKAAGGDREAFARLYAEFARPVFLTLVGMLRSREDAEDALQAAFLSAWEQLPRLRRRERFVPWLFRIARNKGKDLARRRRDRLTDDAMVEDLIDPGTAPADEESIERTLASLTPETRSLVLLRAVHGWSAEEVAKALGKSAATVRRKYARALQHLRTRIGEGVGHVG
jgi:RNA polymerase sigma-70 factor (ECF subfamily)